MDKSYTAPTITEVATLHELTLADTPKKYATPSDGFSFDGKPINVS